VISSPGGAMSSAMLSSPYDVEVRHQSTISSSVFRRMAYSGSEVMGGGWVGLWSITEHQNSFLFS